MHCSVKKALVISGFLFSFICSGWKAFAQAGADSLFKVHGHKINLLADSLQKLIFRFGELSKDPTYTGTRLISQEESSAGGILTFGGYVAAYTAYYTDTSGQEGFQKFPTISPRKNTFGLDIAMITARYSQDKVRGILGLHIGDIPASAWSKEYNIIQEANAGIRLHKKWWLDAGFFRTHIGLESIQPRENTCQSISVLSYYEPYYLSGAKLSFLMCKNWTLQAQVFNGFNGFVTENKRKAFGLSALYEHGDHFSLTTNLMYSDDAIGNEPAQTRFYSNSYCTYKNDNWFLGLEFNTALQHSINPIAPQNGRIWEWMASAMVSARRKISADWFGYSRFEFFRDPDEMLTGPFYNETHNLIGLQAEAFTLGAEWKPLPNAHIRLESRGIYTRYDENVFQFEGKTSPVRIELIAGMGVWF